MLASITVALILTAGAAGGIQVPLQEASSPTTLGTASNVVPPAAIEVLTRTGGDLLQSSTASPRMRAAATGWLDSIRPNPGFATRFESLKSRERIADYLDARFEAELLRGGMLEPRVLEAMEAIPAELGGRGELQWSLAGLLLRPASDLPSGRSLDCTFRLGPTHAPIIDLIATVEDCRDLGAIFDAADLADRPMIGAAVLATGRCPDVDARILDYGTPAPPEDSSAATEAYRTALLVELADRNAGAAILTMIERHPRVLARTGIRAAAAAGLARAGRIDDVLELIGGSEMLDRFPAASSGAIRAAMAHAAFLNGDRDRARRISERISRGDSRLLAELVLADPALADPLDPAPPLADARNLRIVRPMQWAAMIEDDPSIRMRIIRILAALLEDGRTPLALELLAPNGLTTRVGGDGWYQDRIGMLSDAMALANRPMNDWIPLLKAMTRLKSPASQIEALAGIARGLERSHPGDPMTPELRAALDRSLLDITIGG
ncbi:MAG: hypothetical protein CMJ27_03005 [Phycisphaerae bacterium]|nr:hypothetical protein [Phycisphaerae bacterium]